MTETLHLDMSQFYKSTTLKRNVFIDENVGIKIRNNTTDIASFGDDVTLNGGTITIANSTKKSISRTNR